MLEKLTNDIKNNYNICNSKIEELLAKNSELETQLQVKTELYESALARDEARQTLNNINEGIDSRAAEALEAENHEVHQQFSRKCECIIDGVINRHELLRMLQSADNDGNLQLRNQIEIELMIYDYVQKMEKRVNGLQEDVRNQIRSTATEYMKQRNFKFTTIGNHDAKFVIISDVSKILTQSYDYAALLNVPRSDFTYCNHSAIKDDIGYTIAVADKYDNKFFGRKTYIYAVRLCKDESIIIIEERGFMSIFSLF
jgi:cell division septum initiation protein DivIVA